MLKRLALALLLLAFFQKNQAQPKPRHNLRFPDLPTRWDEALPLGNGLLGCLVWKKDGKLRLSLDRADLWDLRPMPNMHDTTLTYRWVAEQVRRGDYTIVQEKLDAPYEREPAPSKLPGAAIEFDVAALGPLRSAELDISNGLATVEWANGAVFQVFLRAENDLEGRFRWDFSKMTTDWKKFSQKPQLIPPKYSGDANQAASGSVAGDDLARLGYRTGEVVGQKGVTYFHQPCWVGFSYQAAVATKVLPQGSEGVWYITAHFPNKRRSVQARRIVKYHSRKPFDRALKASKIWWKDYWKQSSVSLPDTLLDRQYHLDCYKFGCLARSFGPMISLQGLWTADNGRLPPWKGDYHHDLNTELSYWHCLPANHLPESRSYLLHILSNDKVHRAWTRRYFGTEGINVPGVETLLGQPMGGWIQYSCSPTTAAWIANHFYLYWRYSQDRDFLKRTAYPFLSDVARHLEQLLVPAPDSHGLVLPLSSTPELHDNSLKAWFPNTWTNYDLALAVNLFEKTSQMASVLGKIPESGHWWNLSRQLPVFHLSDSSELLFAPGEAYESSHRHFSHLLAIHPLGLIDLKNGPADSLVIRRSLDLLEKHGSDWWTGYSFAWFANLQARARDAEKARTALRTFAEAFVSKNSFHLNGDQSGRGHSKFTYRPFTLEGNFAFAAGVQEMLLQSQRGVIHVFPAVPDDWQDISFKNLRAEGAVLVSAERQGGRFTRVEFSFLKYGNYSLQLPPGEWKVEKGKRRILHKSSCRTLTCLETRPGKVVFVRN